MTPRQAWGLTDADYAIQVTPPLAKGEDGGAKYVKRSLIARDFDGIFEPSGVAADVLIRLRL